MGTDRRTTPQSLTVEYTVTGTLDGTTPAPAVDIDPNSPARTPFDAQNQIYTPEPVGSLGLIDPDLLMGGSIGVRCIPFVTVDAPGGVGGVGASVDVVALRLDSDEDVVFQRQVEDLAGDSSPIFIDRGFNVPQGSAIRLRGFSAVDGPIRVRVSMLVPETCAEIAAFEPVPEPVPPVPPAQSGPGWFLEAMWVDGANEDPAADGSMLNPFPTIQQAVDALAAAQDALPVGHANPEERAQTRQVIVVASGFYDEEVGILRGNTFIEMLALGPVTLGDGAADDNFGSTTPRSITWANSQSQEDADSGSNNDNRRPQLVLSTYHDQSGDATSTHIQIADGWDISGDLVLTNTGVPPGNTTTAELHLNNVRVRGSLDASGDGGVRNCYFRGCRFDGQVLNSPTGGLFLQIAERTRFSALAPGLAHTFQFYNRMWMCLLLGNFTAVGGVVAAFNGVPPSGCYQCVFGNPDTGTGMTFTAPNVLRLDGSSNYWFKTLASVLAGGAVKTILDDLTP